MLSSYNGRSAALAIRVNLVEGGISIASAAEHATFPEFASPRETVVWAVDRIIFTQWCRSSWCKHPPKV